MLLYSIYPLIQSALYNDFTQKPCFRLKIRVLAVLDSTTGYVLNSISDRHIPILRIIRELFILTWIQRSVYPDLRQAFTLNEGRAIWYDWGKQDSN